MIMNGSTPLAAGVLTVVGMCLPWAHSGSRSITGWHGYADLVGVRCPGVCVIVVAGIAVSALRSRSGQQADEVDVPRWFLPLAMCGYGIFHAAFMGLALCITRGMSVGVGIPVTMLSFCVMAFFAFH